MYRVHLRGRTSEPSTYRQCRSLDEAQEIAKEWLAAIHRVPETERPLGWELLIEKAGNENNWTLVGQSDGKACSA